MTRLYLDTAIRLPAPDVEALIQGRAIAAIPQQFLDPGRIFALYPADAANSPPINSATVQIKAWARCELCQILDKSEPLESLSRLTIWTTESLENILSQRPFIFLAYFRVYLLPEPLEIPANTQGQFVGLPQAMNVDEASPVLSDRTFSQRRHQLENRLPPLHPELEDLQSAIAQLTTTNPDAEKLNHRLKIFLGYSSSSSVKKLDPEHAWISTINALGNATTGGNYEKGTAFEQIVHKSLRFLHFELDPNAKGGAGGMDLYCTKPYPLVGECKAGKSIPDNTVEELDRIGKRHLKADYEKSIKLIIGPGEPTKNLKESAKISKISIIKPMTLQKLVELEANYPGSVNAIELKAYLGAGQSDSQIDEYIKKVLTEIKLRSHVVGVVKKYLENTGLESAGVDALHGIYFGSNPPQPLKTEEMYEILIELSSPLTGFLGRNKASDWRSDRFYFLRELLIDLD